MENTSADNNQANFALPGLFEMFLTHLVFNWVNIFQLFFSRNQFFLQTQFSLCEDSKVLNETKKGRNPKICSREKGKDEILCREDVEMVMEKLGIHCNSEDAKIEEKVGLKELSNIFEEKEPSFEEMKEAFGVFDVNGDGFIDADELERVLSVLGYGEGFDPEKCKRMIRSFDENGDGRIDFVEFVKLMENSFF